MPIRAIRNRLGSSRLLRSMAWVGGGGMIGQAATAVGILIAARQYPESAFGILGAYVSIVSILGASTTLRYDLAIPIAKDEDEAANCLVLSMMAAFITSALVALVLLLWLHPLMAAFNTRGLTPFAWMLPLGLLGTGIYNGFNYVATRNKQFKALGATRANQGIVTSVLMVGIGFFSHSPLGLLSGHMVSRYTGVGRLGKESKDENGKWLVTRASWAGMKAAAKAYHRFPLYSTWASMLNTAGLFLPALLVQKLFGDTANGYWTLASRVVGLPVALLIGAISPVFMGEAGQLLLEAPQKLVPLFDRITKKSLLVGIGVGILGLSAPFITPFLFGEKWRPAGLLILMQAWHYAGTLVVTPISSVAGIAQKQAHQLAADFTRVVFIVSAFHFASAQKWTLDQAAALYVVSALFTYVLFYFLYRWITVTEVQRRIKEMEADG